MDANMFEDMKSLLMFLYPMLNEDSRNFLQSQVVYKFV